VLVSREVIIKDNDSVRVQYNIYWCITGKTIRHNPLED
jgi:hypothetical protein